ncbi:unnamed protein product, partial [Cuscuta epithymum]
MISGANLSPDASLVRNWMCGFKENVMHKGKSEGKDAVLSIRPLRNRDHGGIKWLGFGKRCFKFGSGRMRFIAPLFFSVLRPNTPEGPVFIHAHQQHSQVRTAVRH